MGLSSTILSELSDDFQANISGCSVVFDIDYEVDDNTSLPQIEINRIRKTRNNFGTSNQSQHTTQVIFIKETLNQKLSLLGMEEKEETELYIDSLIRNWYIRMIGVYPVGELSSIETDYIESLFGVYGSRNIIRITKRFTIDLGEL